MQTAKVIVTPYNKAWKADFEAIRAELAGIDADRLNDSLKGLEFKRCEVKLFANRASELLASFC